MRNLNEQFKSLVRLTGALFLFQDIIVGAPYYSMSSKELMDNGAVYIYMNNPNV